MRSVGRLILVVVACASVATAQILPNLGGQRVGISSLQFLKIGADARGSALGEAMAAVANDVSALYWNPAGLTLMNADAALISHATWLVELRHDFGGAIYHLSASDVVGLSVLSLTTDEMPVTTETQPTGTGVTFGYSDLAIGLTYARQMTNQFSFGVTGRYVVERLANVRIKAFLFDLGTHYRIGIGSARFGVVVSNFGSDVAPAGSIETLDHRKVSTFQQFSPPTSFKIGFAFEPLEDELQRVTTSVQLNHPNDNAENFRIGVEYGWDKWLFLRAGVKRTVGDPLFGMSRRSADDLSFGFGVFVPVGPTDVQFDYAYTHFNELGAVHRLSMGFTY